MRAIRFTLLSNLVFAALIVGCRKEPQTAPATQSVDTASTTSPTTSATHYPTEPVSMTIDGQLHEFPPAKLILSSGGDQTVAVLICDDPPNASDEAYMGNTIYLKMPLETGNPDSPAVAVWEFKTADEDRAEAVDGVYLQGRRKFLQPLEVRVAIDTAEQPATLSIDGTFLLFKDDADEPTPPTRVKISAELTAPVELKKARDPAE